ncbi:MAG: hypothetical protein ACLUHE_05080 [Christensenellales bacterium]
MANSISQYIGLIAQNRFALAIIPASAFSRLSTSFRDLPHRLEVNGFSDK